LRFPRDHGAHPQQRIEWWYLTAWADERTGVQITLFRARLGRRRDAAFGNDQILIGHVAVVREDWPSVIHSQTAWRSLEGLTVCATDDMRLQCPGWWMQREPDDNYLMRVEQGRLKVQLRARAPDAPVLQGLAGHSRKGPKPDQFSRYYSRTQMRLEARIQVNDQTLALSGGGRNGVAWFDHEWSDQLLDAAAAGWDWFGLNFDDGSAWMAFRIRDRSGSTLWTSEPDLRFEVSENWTSPLSGARYPIGLRIYSRRGTFLLKPLIAAQEIDARASTGNRYWEGAVRAYDHQGQQIGRGYLELTGYDRPMRL
jgi:predicted secreted hydrolase